MKISEEKKLEILKEEYFRLLDVIFHYDNLVFKIKAVLLFIITTLTGIIVKYKFDEGIWIILLLTFISWFLEALLKTFQYLNYRRINEIAAFMRGDISEIYLLQANSIWYKEFKKKFAKIWFRSFLRFYVSIPYSIVIVGGLFLSGFKVYTILYVLLLAFLYLCRNEIIDYIPLLMDKIRRIELCRATVFRERLLSLWKNILNFLKQNRT